jgi:LmbE family N-acetylglucosaminyl deacetylase
VQSPAWVNVRILCIGAHPDDCEIEFGGTAAKLAARGDEVKFLSVTNGDAGHHEKSAAELAQVRRQEAAAAAARLGIAASEVLANHDGELLPTLEARAGVVRAIRSWKAEVVLSHRPWDYHPDHRYTGQLVQDSAYLVVVPKICPDTPPLRRNPLFLYLQDSFQLPAPFIPDIAVDIDDAWEQKMDAMDAHVSQFYEWLPWVDGVLDEVPSGQVARRNWLSERWTRPLNPCTRAALGRRYGSRAQHIRHAETFQVCEYGRRPTPEELEDLFPE